MFLYEKKRGTLKVTLDGELDHRVCQAVRGELDEMVMDPGVRRLIFDVKNLEFMDSSGVGLIIGRYKTLSRRGGTVAVTGARGVIDRIFQMSGLYQIIEKMG